MAGTTCIGCGAEVPDSEGPVHAYMTSAPGCWERYGLLLAWCGSLAGEDGVTITQLVVDTYAVQHPTNPDRRNRRSVAVHLMSLCAALEHEVPGSELRRSLGGWTHRDYPAIAAASAPPPIVDVLEWPVAERGARSRDVAQATWEAWAPHHPSVRSWLDHGQGGERRL